MVQVFSQEEDSEPAPINTKMKEPACKRHKTLTEEDNHGDCNTGLKETNLVLEDLDKVNDVTSLPWLEEDISEGPPSHIQVSRPKPRPLRDPL